MALKLFGEAQDLRVAQVLSLAEFLNTKIEVVNTKKSDKIKSTVVAKDALYAETRPALDTGLGYFVYGSVPILHFLACKNADKDLLGSSYYEKSRVESALYVCTAVLEDLYYRHIANASAKIDDKVIKELTAFYKNLNEYFLTNTYLVGENITVADICVAAAVNFIAKNNAVKIDLNTLPNLLRWYNTIVQQHGICKVLVVSKCASSEPSPAKEEEKQTVDDEVLAVKELDECTIKFDIDQMKRVYFNSKDPKKETIDWLLENMDRSCVSIHIADYNKSEDELKNSLSSCNQLGGFMQRFHTVVRKHCFVGFVIVGEEGNYDITGLLLVKGAEIPRVITKVHPSFEYYSTRKLNIDDSKDRAVLEDYLFAFRNGETLNGRPILDVKMLR